MKLFIHALFALFVTSSAWALESGTPEPFGICGHQVISAGFVLGEGSGYPSSDPLTLPDLDDQIRQCMLDKYFGSLLLEPKAALVSTDSVADDDATLPRGSFSEESHSSSSSTHSCEAFPDSLSSEPEPISSKSSSPKRKKKKKKKKASNSGPAVDPDWTILEEASRAAAASRMAASVTPVTLAINLHEYARFFPFKGFEDPFHSDRGNVFESISEIRKSDFNWPRRSVFNTYIFSGSPFKIIPLIDPETDKEDIVLYEPERGSLLSFGFGDRFIRIYGKPNERVGDPAQKCLLELIVKNASRVYHVGEEGYSDEEDFFLTDPEVRTGYIDLLDYLNGIPAFEEVSPELVRSKIASERRSLTESRTFYYLAVREKGSENVFLVAVRNKPEFSLEIVLPSANPEDDAAVLEKLNAYFKAMPCLKLPAHVDYFRRRI